jgi:glycosyltransferase involved in cell wall biosynthesis
VQLGLTRGARFNLPETYRSLYPDLDIHEVDGRFGTRSARVRALRASIERHRPDVVLSMRVFDVLPALRACRPRPRLAYGVRALEAAYIEDVRRFGGSMDLCVTSGRLIESLCVAYGGMPREHVVSIGGGVREDPARRSAPRTGPRSPIRLLYAGRLDAAQKRSLDLPGILDRLDRLGVAFTLQLVGAGPAEAELRERLAPRVADGAVAFHGWVEAAALHEHFFPEADVFLHTAGWEGITIAPREAMVHGVVPVVSEFPGARCEGVFVDDQTALTFPVGDLEAAASAVARLAADPGLCARLSRAAAASQTGERTEEGAMDAWARALEGSLERPGRSAELPSLPPTTDGRLQRFGVPERLADALRGLLGRAVRHGDPGSEWPTASGLLTDDARRRIEDLAAELDVAPCPAS